jgi:hypothetical protein
MMFFCFVGLVLVLVFVYVVFFEFVFFFDVVVGFYNYEGVV